MRIYIVTQNDEAVGRIELYGFKTEEEAQQFIEEKENEDAAYFDYEEVEIKD